MLLKCFTARDHGVGALVIFVIFQKKISIPTSDATFDVITSNLMFSTHHLMFDVFADESDVRQSGC